MCQSRLEIVGALFTRIWFHFACAFASAFCEIYGFLVPGMVNTFFVTKWAPIKDYGLKKWWTQLLLRFRVLNKGNHFNMIQNPLEYVSRKKTSRQDQTATTRVRRVEFCFASIPKSRIPDPARLQVEDPGCKDQFPKYTFPKYEFQNSPNKSIPSIQLGKE